MIIFSAKLFPLLRKEKFISLLLAFMLLCIPSMKLMATTQVTFNFHEKNIRLKEMFSKIERSSHYNIFYRLDQVNPNELISVEVKEAPIETVMALVLKNQALDFQVKDNMIIIRSRQDKAKSFGIITGTITDEKGIPLPGVTIQVKGTNIATSSDNEGKFSITVPDPQGILLVSYIGYTSQSFQVNGASNLTIKLLEQSKSLNELVVVGYTSQKKKDLTGAVSVVNVQDLIKTPTASINNQLQGQASGVSVIGSGQPGEAPLIKIRGVNTFGDNTPLYIIDGVQTGDASSINPNDVASLQVLKDAGSASIYGSRASNGVIIISTKKGKGKVKIEYDAYYGTQSPKSGNVWHTLTPQEMANLTQIVNKNSGVADSSVKLYQTGGGTYILPDYIAPEGAKTNDSSVEKSKYFVIPEYNSTVDPSTFYRIVKANKVGTDWFHEIFKPASIMNHNLSISSGNEQGSYLFALNYYNQQGTLLNTFQKRYSLRANSEFNFTKNIKIGENITYSLTDNPQLAINNPDATIAFAIREQPIIPIYDINGNFGGSFTNDGSLGDARNPVAMQYRTRNDRSLDYRLLGSLFIDINFLKYFDLKTTFGGEINTNNSHSFQYPDYENKEILSQNSYSQSSASTSIYNWTNTLTFHKSFGYHDLKVLAGVESVDGIQSNVGGSRVNYYSFDPNYVNLSTGDNAGQSNFGSSTSLQALFSYIGRIDYNYKEKYLINFVGRYDGSSKFVNQFAWFPAITAAWRISQENFMKNITWLTDLKIRGGVGILGNQSNIVDGNQFTNYFSSLASSYYAINGGGTVIPGYYQSTIGNPNAKWEKDVNSNIGIDLNILDDKLSFTLDYYRKDIKDLLFNPALLATNGSATPPFTNVSTMTNDGIDASLSSNFKINKDLKFDATLTLTTYRNRITKIANTANYFDTDFGRRNGGNLVRNQVGHSVGEFFGYQIIGFWNSQAEIDAANSTLKPSPGNPSPVYEQDMGVGRFKYADVNKDGIITDADRTFLGNPNPKFNTGINLGVTFHGLDFSIFIYGVFGNKIWNNVKYWRDFASSFGGANSTTALYNSWTPTHTNAVAPILENNSYFSTQAVPNSYFIENGSYLRAKNAQLGYSFSENFIRKISIKKLRIYLSAANLFTITKYSGSDPEIGGSTTDFGVDEGTYPSSRTLLFGLNLTL